MITRTFTAVAFAACLIVSGAGALAAAGRVEAPQAAQTPQAPHSWKGTIAQGGVLEIKGVNGDIKAAPASGGEVEVAAVMRGRRSNPADVRLDIVQHGDGVTICAVYPSPDGEANSCQPGNGGRMNVRDNDVTVTFTVHVPAGVRFAGRTVNGGITAEALSSPLSAETVNGDITFATSSYGAAKTVNGQINGSIGSADWSEALTFKSVNGSVTIALPADAGAELQATTVNGNISTDFPVSSSGVVNKRQLRGTIGSGGRTLEISTVNGSVTLKRM